MYTALQLLTDELHNARELFEGTVADLTEEQLHKDPGGKALPIGAVYAHLILSEDMTIQKFLQSKTPLSESDWKEKTGVSLPLPPMDEKWGETHLAWSKEVRIDLAQLRQYAAAVFAASDAYVATLKDEDVDKEIDLGGWGKKTVAYMMYGFVIGHMYSLAGEISALKGIFGAKGYPF